MSESDAIGLVASLDAPGFSNLRRAIGQRYDREQRAFELTDEEREMLRSNNKLGAVRSVRDRLNTDLCMAKGLVDRLSGVR